ncbi:3-hydroxyisobutyryl-CoA hydrolase 1-like isoform X2 [Tasmannia lanceolata]|uniref:3-hydroxyisobutyryl-CoA hydrolase 1-like isoform X2 n=1 Tax=Tasmannia lanceolata TaxID=3420 RepID=UPI0040644449
MAFPNSPNEGDQILKEEKHRARILILNRPKKFNALSYNMISLLLKNFKAYEDSNVRLVILKGKGKSFCAGGDAVAIAHTAVAGHWSLGIKIYEKQLKLNYVMATFKKSQVSLINGIVMGGGAGISMHGRFRVVTENAVFAMPETSLGLFPDVGASYFLSRLPGFFGEYVGLTGARLDGTEMLACGLATHFVFAKDLPMLEEALVKMDSLDPAVVCAIIDVFAQKPPLKKNSAFLSLEIISRHFSKGTVEEILSALEHEAESVTTEWILAAIQWLKAASPSSLKISLRSIREGRVQEINQCLIRDYRMASHSLRRTVNNDFFEGCRAILFDKDKQPKWNPSKLELVTKEMVDQYFAKVDDEDWEDLQLPATSGPYRAKL